MSEEVPIHSPWMTVSQVAAYASRSTKTVLRALQARQLAGSQPVRRGHWRIHRDDVDAWIRGDRPQRRLGRAS
ncbi:helix-turn-helix domain-containing protein [Saccharopolyspora oryzae]|uniref:helix-turn-helix domain-containing protein n=1 Tax=Saccharopolyspora oryzae TaxID=2997343 RepID=UPI0038CDB4CE